MILATARRALVKTLGDRVRFDVPMARLTSLRVGGPVDAVVTPANREELAALLGVCREHGLPRYVVGAGFNTLATDARWSGVIVQLSKFRALRNDEGPSLVAEAGVSHSQVMRHCVREGLSGLEFAAGIPGTVGGWVAMNAGIPDREMADTLLEVEVMDAAGRLRSVPRDAIAFRYRSMASLAPSDVIVSARFRVEPAASDDVQARVDLLLARRAKTQPLSVPSCGSVFKNPPGDYAGRLIEASGLKGHRIGGAQISPMHANFIANVGGASAADVLDLIREAQDRVQETQGAQLEREVRIVGGEPG